MTTTTEPTNRDKLTARIRTALQALWAMGITAAAAWAADRFGIDVPEDVSVWLTLAVGAPLVAAVTAALMAVVDRLSKRWPWLQWLFGRAAQARYVG
jgi:hypothetical protein